MKYLFIILISILLLYSAAMGNNDKGETLYRWKKSSGNGYVWKRFGNKENHPLYHGDVKNGTPNGLGILIYKDGRKYEGYWKNGIWNGKGKYSFNDGYGYEGEWKNGVENGMGILTYPNGDKYEGEFKNGKMLNGKMYKENGDIHIQKNNEWIIEKTINTF